jgi:hypothetical protein
MPRKFSYRNSQKYTYGGKKIVKNVTIKNGKGHKSVSKYYNGKKRSTVKKPLSIMEIEHIQIGRFIPGLFNDCSKK